MNYEEIYPRPQDKELVDKTGNQVNVIFPYKRNGIWMFDDPDVGLQAEPFVGIINDMIDMQLNGEEKCIIYISKDPMPNATLSLTNVDKEVNEFLLSEKEDADGVTPFIFIHGNYQLDGTEMVGWLCPATFKYFKGYPDKIYAKIEKNDKAV